MSSSSTCLECGRKLPAGTAGELCDSCLLKLGLEPESPDEATTVVEDSDTGSLDLRESGATLDPLLHASIASGTILAAGRYRVLSLIGRGGMGEVYRAQDLKLRQIVALKFLPEDLELDRAWLSRLFEEVTIARQISHQNVCRVHDIVETKGKHFISMEYIEGEDLSAYLERAGRIPSEKALSIAHQLCAGLAAAHERRVLHRDLKPANVIIDRRGVARIADFGLAGKAEALRASNTRAGTPLYMAPETLAHGEASERSDIYSLGLVLYEIFTGERAQRFGSHENVKRGNLHVPPEPSSLAPDIDPDVERTILRCLESDPERRPSSAKAVAAALPGAVPFGRALAAAQQRADQIGAFQTELTELLRAGAIELDEEELAGIERYHRGELESLVQRFDVDVSAHGKQLSMGMKSVSLLSALALGASMFYGFYQFWGVIPVAVQVVALTVAPLASLLVAVYVVRKERSGYFAAIACFFTFISLILDIVLLQDAFAIVPSVFTMLVPGVLALLLAYGYRVRSLLAVGLLTLSGFLSAFLFAWNETYYWIQFKWRPETFFVAGLSVLAVSQLSRHQNHPQFVPVYRGVGVLCFLLPILVLAMHGDLSFLPLPVDTIEATYQALGFLCGAGMILLGIALRWKETLNMSTSFFVVLLYIKFIDWWWDWMPKYLFFLLVGLSAMIILVILKRGRERIAAALREVSS